MTERQASFIRLCIKRKAVYLTNLEESRDRFRLIKRFNAQKGSEVPTESLSVQVMWFPKTWCDHNHFTSLYLRGCGITSFWVNQLLSSDPDLPPVEF